MNSPRGANCNNYTDCDSESSRVEICHTVERCSAHPSPKMRCDSKNNTFRRALSTTAGNGTKVAFIRIVSRIGYVPARLEFIRNQCILCPPHYLSSSQSLRGCHH